MNLINQVKKDFKGAIGELKIDLILGRFTSEYNFKVRDLLLMKDGKSTQIDNVLVTNKKIYVIESKNYSGWIFGSENSKTWTQTFNFYGKVTKSSFFNPLNQNCAHIRYLSKFLDIPLSYFINIVVFSNQAELKNIKTDKSYNHVINQKNLVSLLDSLELVSKKSFDWEDIEKLKDSINFINKSGLITNIQHKSYVKTNKNKYGIK